MEKEIKKTVVKFHAFDELPMRDLKAIDEAMNKIGFKGSLIDNGNVVYEKQIFNNNVGDNYFCKNCGKRCEYESSFCIDCINGDFKIENEKK